MTVGSFPVPVTGSSRLGVARPSQASCRSTFSTHRDLSRIAVRSRTIASSGKVRIGIRLLRQNTDGTRFGLSYLPSARMHSTSVNLRENFLIARACGHAEGLLYRCSGGSGLFLRAKGTQEIEEKVRRLAQRPAPPLLPSPRAGAPRVGQPPGGIHADADEVTLVVLLLNLVAAALRFSLVRGLPCYLYSVGRAAPVFDCGTHSLGCHFRGTGCLVDLIQATRKGQLKTLRPGLLKHPWVVAGGEGALATGEKAGLAEGGPEAHVSAKAAGGLNKQLPRARPPIGGMEGSQTSTAACFSVLETPNSSGSEASNHHFGGCTLANPTPGVDGVPNSIIIASCNPQQGQYTLASAGGTYPFGVTGVDTYSWRTPLVRQPFTTETMFEVTPAQMPHSPPTKEYLAPVTMPPQQAHKLQPVGKRPQGLQPGGSCRPPLMVATALFSKQTKTFNAVA